MQRSPPDRERELTYVGPLDIVGTLRRQRLLSRDPTSRVDGPAVWRAFHSPDGPVTVRYEAGTRSARAEAWGPGADWAMQTSSDILGLHDDPLAWRPDCPRLARLQRRFAGTRFGASRLPMHTLTMAVLAQKVTTREAGDSWAGLCRRWGQPAPGGFGLWVPPSPEALARLAWHDLHRVGVERRRAETLLRACRRARRIREAMELGTDEAMRRLQSLPGIGPWTAAHVVGAATGDPDLVPSGDYNLPHSVAWALAGERRADDARMFELLEPYRPHRARVVRWVMSAGAHPPRRGPRARVRAHLDG